jgi:transposase/transcriptional regulator with XRE-family HTH domain
MVTVKKKQLSDVQKARALAWNQEHVSQVEICRRLGVSRSTISRLFSAAKKLNPDVLPSRKIGSGRPRKVSVKMLKKISKDICENPFMTARQIKNKNPRLLDDISLRTIRNVLLNYLNLKSRVAAKKPVLSEKMKQKRLAFAKKYKHWSSSDWCRVCFSDESLFETSMTTNGRLVRRADGTDRYQTQFTSKTINFAPSLMVWGCFSSKGTGGLSVLPQNVTMDSTRYLKILQQKLKKPFKEQKCSFFQQDNARVHTAKKITKFLKEENIMVVKWPGNSPDIAPIENLWGLMKCQLERKDIRSISKLRKEIRKSWRELKLPFLKNLAKSMPKRLQLMIKNRGEMIKY